MTTTTIEIRRAPTDPACVRVSLGGSEKIGYYCTYRGKVADAVAAAEKVLLVLRIMQDKGVEAPMDENILALGEQGLS